MQLRHLLKSIYSAPPSISIKAYDYTKQRGGGSRCSIPVITFTRRLSVAPSCNGNSKLHETLGCTRSNKISISRRTQSTRACIFNAETARRRKEKRGKERKGEERKGCPGCYVAAATPIFLSATPLTLPSFYPLTSPPLWTPLPRRRVSPWIKVASHHDDA